MKVVVTKRFIDLENKNKVQEVGTKIEVTPERYKKIEKYVERQLEEAKHGKNSN